MSVNEKMTAIADAIRDKTGETEKLGLDAMVDGVNKVYDLGKQAEYDRFWDAYQDYGDRNSYAYAFAGQAWTDETYNPKYPINATGNANALFINNAQITDTKVPINLGTTTLNKAGMFEYATNLVTIRELTWDCDIKFANQFTGCKKLKNISLNGTITRDINMQWCPLTGESVDNIIFALADYLGTDDEWKYTITLSQSSWTAVNAYAEELTQKHNEETGENVTASEYVWDSYSDAQDFVENRLGWLIG